MILASQQPQENKTPNELTETQNMLQLAGSKFSYGDIYNKELDLPRKGGKYYPIKDVDALFILINGVFENVSEQSARDKEAIKTARAAAAKAETAKNVAEKSAESLNDQLKQLQDMNGQLQLQVTNLQQQVSTLENQEPEVVETPVADVSQINDLTAQLEQRQEEYSKLAQTSSDAMSELESQIQALMAQKTTLEDDLAAALNSNTELIASQSTLQSDFDVLKYKYTSLKTMTAQRLQELSGK